MPPTAQRFGGSFAPPLSADTLAVYADLISAVEDRRAKDYLQQLHLMTLTFQQTPASTLKGTPHKSGTGAVIPLEPAEIERIYDLVPWGEELDVMSDYFDRVFAASPRGSLSEQRRNMAFHLIWYGRELLLDREPITSDML